jgi:hypothetical protein
MNQQNSLETAITDDCEDASLLDQIVENSKSKPASPAGILIGLIVDIHATGLPIVEILDPAFVNDQPIVAQAICSLSALKVGRQCAVSLTAGDRPSAIVLGQLQSSVFGLGDSAEISVSQSEGKIDIQSDNEINLRCGKATLRMTSAGLVEIRGKKVVSHSSGLNRIRGGSVKLN